MSTLHGAHLGGASTLLPSLQLGAASIGSLDPAHRVREECLSSYAQARGPLFFSEEGSGGGSSSMTMPGPLAQNIDRPAGPKLDQVKEVIGLRDTDSTIAIDRKLSEFSSRIILEDDEGQDSMMDRLDKYYRAFNFFDILLDDGNTDIVLHAIRYMSQSLMVSDTADAIYPESQMTYRGRFLKRANEAWNRGKSPASETPTPMVELVRSLGTNRSALPESAILKLNDIAVSQDKDEFLSLVNAIAAEATSDNVDRSTSAAFAFVLSARLLEDPSRLEELTNAFLDQVEWSASLFRDNVNYWIPMGAISDTGSLIDEPAMYTKFMETIVARYTGIVPPFAVPAIFQLAAHLQDKDRIEELVTLVQKDYKSWNVMEAFRYLRVPNYVLLHEWKFTAAELAILTKAADVLKIEPYPGSTF